jgi:hypothetical protein
MGKAYRLAKDIDLASTTVFPIGSQEVPFTGTFDGNNKVISGFRYTGTEEGIGVFGVTTNTAVIKNVIVEAAQIRGKSTVGGLVGLAAGSTIQDSSFSGLVSGDAKVGGLVGRSESAKIKTSSVQGYVDSLQPDGSTVYPLEIGGFVGQLSGASVLEDCYTQARVSVEAAAPRFANSVGGFVGFAASGSIKRTYAASKVEVIRPATINVAIGPFAGSANANIIDQSYYDSSLVPLPPSNGFATGRTTANMQIQGNYANWDFTDVWMIPSGGGYPVLR